MLRLRVLPEDTAMLETRLTKHFGVEYPIMSAPMSMHSSGPLAAAVSRAGGIGLFGGTHPSGAEWLREQIGVAGAASEGRPFGVGFITHMIPAFPELFDVAVQESVPIIAFSFADPAPYIPRAKDAGATVLCQVQSLAAAEQAVLAGTDMLVVQGNEAGGHTGKAKLMPLLSDVRQRFPDLPVLAAGGIADGRGLAAVLSAGADGAWLGTALLATHECSDVPDAYKQKLVQSRSEDTRYTEVFDILDVAAYGIPPWPDGIAGRTITNEFVEQWHGRESVLSERLEDLLPDYRAAAEARDVDRTAVWAGESVNFIDEVRPVADVLRTICDDAERRLQR